MNILILLLISTKLNSQELPAETKNNIDSIEKVIVDTKSDTLKINAYAKMSELLRQSDQKKHESILWKIIKLSSDKLKNGNPDEKEITFYAIKIARAYNNLGNLYENKGKYPESLKYYLSALKISEKYDYKEGTAISLGNIGIIYEVQENYEEALAYHFRSLGIFEEIKMKKGISDSYINIGNVHYYKKEYETAFGYYSKSLKLKEEMNDLIGMTMLNNNLGVLLTEQQQYEKSLEYYLKSLELKIKLGNQQGIIISYHNIGLVYFNLKKMDKAREYYRKSLDASLNLGYLEHVRNAYYGLFQLDSADTKFSDALEHYKFYVRYRDSLTNNENTKKMVEQAMQYKFNKKQTEDSVQNANEKEVQQAKIDKQNTEIKAKKIQQYFLFGGLASVFLFAGFMFNRFRITRKQKIIIENQKEEVEHQKELVDEKQKEIIDSINYARRLQQAILARPEEIKKHLPESFLLYKPKDIVAGDFYFFEVSETYIFIAAADCTGHGVPGAMVSIVCSNALTRCVKEFKLTDPGKILDKTRELVVETFEKSGSDVKDGMDISLLSVAYRAKSESETDIIIESINWSGANNPLWYIESAELKEITADKQPIGKSDNPKPFSTHMLPLPLSLSALFLFTDGYADQFGGPKGKKLNYSNFKKMLLENSTLPPEIIGKNLEKSFLDWKGNLEQLDDVCIIGIKPL